MTLSRHWSAHCRRAFSLIELIASVVVVMVLASIVMAVMQRMQNSTHSVNCVNNLRGLGQAMSLYISDMDQRIVSRTGGAGRSAGDMWAAELSGRGYLLEPSRDLKHITLTGKDPQIVKCPLGKLPDNVGDANWAWFTYGLNMFSPGSRTEVIGDTTLSVREVSNVESANLVLLADSLSGPSGTQTFRIRSGTVDGIELRHNGRANVLFLDNHIESIDRERAVELGFPAVY